MAHGAARPAVRRGLAAIALVVFLAGLLPVIWPVDPTAQLDRVNLSHAGPTLEHPFGTDLFSRDVLARVVHGARISLAVATLAVAISVSIGVLVGLAAGWTGGILDAVLMRAVDVFLAVPRLFLLLVILASWPELGLTALVLILGLTSWFTTSRIVRAEVLALRNRDFVRAARAAGLPARRVIARHLLPNIRGPIVVAATLGMGQIILIEAGLSYLGLGVRPPTPSLGSMISEGQPFLLVAPWVAGFPGLVVVVTVLAFSALGEGLRPARDPGAA